MSYGVLLRSLTWCYVARRMKLQSAWTEEEIAANRRGEIASTQLAKIVISIERAT